MYKLTEHELFGQLHHYLYHKVNFDGSLDFQRKCGGIGIKIKDRERQVTGAAAIKVSVAI